ncbi:MAG: type I restriction endonuclease subunit R [Clostridia bacterium]|nr:type I restriction endonuclease subunit R [Clostridia bacterium]
MEERSKYNVVSENNHSTVVSNYIPTELREEGYQSEGDLERKFIELLTEQSYDFIKIVSEDDLISNLRNQLEKLNNYTFSDKEWDYFFKNNIASSNDGIVQKTRKIQEDYIQVLTRDNGETKNIYLIDKDNIHNNKLQVTNQYENEGVRLNRYDVTVLVNGLPMVHIELKRRGVDIKEAFNQIRRYANDSFSSNSGLFEYVQIFVISNGTYTKYYSNTTRDLHLKNTTKKTSNTFEFTSFWADSKNRPIIDLMDFGKTFFAKHTILNVITKYCVFTSENMLLVMRPYQIVATEKIVNRIEIAHNYKKQGSIDAGGYIWHTTGSGKTLTSFKTALIAKQLEYVDKVLFVVDRKDLDYQTMKEYDKFQKGSANSNTSTNILKKQLEDPNSKIIITTIQKLDNFIKKNADNEVYNKDTVIIFDECHRSQFGGMHKAITKKFKKYYIFGFTGTPIFAKNTNSSVNLKTTEQLFGDKLHTYTIVDAINDKNVLPFRVEFVNTIKEKEDIEDKRINAIDKEKVLMNPQRINNITNYVIEHFAQKTKNNESYTHNTLNNVKDIAKNNRIDEIRSKKQILGFNSLFACSSIEMAKMYYSAFACRKEHNLKIALIYSFGVNEDLDGASDILIEENSEDTNSLDKSSRDFLESSIKDYNNMFGTSYDTSSDKFQNYYKDVSLRMKNREIDILIVANMFLTGFDATTLNTLWVDKNLKYHGLLQAFSRTNRILNSIKTFGNIVCFRNLENELNDALTLFGDKEARGIVLLKSYEEYYNGYEDDKDKFEGYKSLVERLKELYPIGIQIIGEKAKKEFIKLYGAILKVRNILATFDTFQEDTLLVPRELQDYHSMYIDMYNEFRNTEKVDKENIEDDIVFEMELIKQIEVNIDYILELIKKYHDSNMEDKEILINIDKAISSSVELRNKKDLINGFIASLNADSNIHEDFEKYMNEKKKEELNRIIEEEGLNRKETYDFVERAFMDGNVQVVGTAITKVLPPISRFTPDNDRNKKKNIVINKIIEFFNRFFSISSTKF